MDYEFDAGWVIILVMNVEDEFMNWIQVGFDCWSNLDTNVKDGYKCYGLLQMSKIYNLGYIRMLRMDS